jgi:hypothetical protein
MTTVPRTVKPVGQLRTNDLERHWLWDFASDVEGMPDQDETSMEPIACACIPASCLGGSAMVAADFVGPTGLAHVGLVSLATGPGVWGAIITDKAYAPIPHPTFWLADSMLAFAEKQLGFSREQFLTLTFRLRLPYEGENVTRSGVFVWRTAT